MSYSLATIWYERSRFLPAILAVAFSALLIATQTGLLISLLSMMSLPVDKSAADIWVGFPDVKSVDLGRPMPERYLTRVAAQPEVIRVEPAVVGFGLWTRAGKEAPPEVCTIVGTRIDRDSLGVVEQIRNQPELLSALSEPATVVIDDTEFGRLGVSGIGDTAEIFGVRVRVVGTTHGYKSLGGPYVFCNLETARPFLRNRPDEAIYILAKCKNPEDVQMVVERLKGYPKMSPFTKDEFSLRSRLHWLTTTKAGLALGFTAMLGLLVGAVVTSQTLYAATAASKREYATLRAMGIPRWRLKMAVLAQSFWVGFFGIAVAIPLTFGLSQVGALLGTNIRLPFVVLAGAAVITMTMAMVSGLAALRSFSSVDPAHNIR